MCATAIKDIFSLKIIKVKNNFGRLKKKQLIAILFLILKDGFLFFLKNFRQNYGKKMLFSTCSDVHIS